MQYMKKKTVQFVLSIVLMAVFAFSTVMVSSVPAAAADPEPGNLYAI